MKKLLFVGALSSLLLAACTEDNANEKVVLTEETPIETTTEKDETLTDAQISTINAFESNDFIDFANQFYDLDSAERSDLYQKAVEAQYVTWSGVITDLDTISDSIIIIGKTDAYTGADWKTLQQDTPELLPYTIVVQMNDPRVKEELNIGDTITIEGEIGARGDAGLNYNWKLYKGEIIN